MSATDELRRMLDERGVEWTYGDGTVSFTSDSHWCHAWDYDDGAMCVSMGYFTPEQAIEATLGRGTCHAANVAEYAWDDFECSECGWVTWSFLMEHEGCGTVCQPRFCPNCGAKVVYE